MKKKDHRLSIDLTEELKEQYQDIREELGLTHKQLIAYLISLHKPKFDKGMLMVERTVRLMLTKDKEDKERIYTKSVIDNTLTLFGKVPNFRTVLQVIHAFQDEIELLNGEPFPKEYFDKVRAKK